MARAPGTDGFFEGCPVKWATAPGVVDGGVEQGPWLQERVGGAVGAGWQFQRRGRVGAWLAVPKRGKLAWQFHRRGQGLGGGIQGLEFRKGRCVIFRKLEG